MLTVQNLRAGHQQVWIRRRQADLFFNHGNRVIQRFWLSRKRASSTHNDPGDFRVFSSQTVVDCDRTEVCFRLSLESTSLRTHHNHQVRWMRFELPGLRKVAPEFRVFQCFAATTKKCNQDWPLTGIEGNLEPSLQQLILQNRTVCRKCLNLEFQATPWQNNNVDLNRCVIFNLSMMQHRSSQRVNRAHQQLQERRVDIGFAQLPERLPRASSFRTLYS